MDETSTSKLSVKRRWMFRVMALVVGVALLALLEFVLVIGGWGTPSPKEDPFAGFLILAQLFKKIMSEIQTIYFTNKGKYPIVRPSTMTP